MSQGSGGDSEAGSAPWDIDVVIQFTDERRAVAFERYLKSGSGCAFAKRHLRFSRKTSTTEAPTPFVPAVTSARRPESPRSKLMP